MSKASWSHSFGRNTTPVKYVCSECLEEKIVSELNVTSDGSAYICDSCQKGEASE